MYENRLKTFSKKLLHISLSQIAAKLQAIKIGGLKDVLLLGPPLYEDSLGSLHGLQEHPQSLKTITLEPFDLRHPHYFFEKL